MRHLTSCLFVGLLAAILSVVGCCKCGERGCPCKQPEKSEPADKAR